MRHRTPFVSLAAASVFAVLTQTQFYNPVVTVIAAATAGGATWVTLAVNRPS